MSDYQTENQFDERVIDIARVAKVVKGGRRFSFRVVMVIGDNNGRVGLGMGKANSVPDAIRKASDKARKNMRRVNLNGTSIPHEVIGKQSGARVLLRPAAAGTGVIAGGAMRALFDVLGIHNVLAKCIGSNNPINVVRATMNGLNSMTSPEDIAAKRGKTVAEILG